MTKNQNIRNNTLMIRILLFVVILLQFQVVGFCQVRSVWALGDGEKVFRNDDNHPGKNGNFVWDGKTIRLKGLYNEVLAFQIIVEADKQGAKEIELSVSAPVERMSNRVIGENTAKYGPKGTVEIYSEHYLQVTDSTAPNWYYGSVAAQPKKMTGWIPDALIPANALPGKGGFPIDIAAVKDKDKHFIGCSSQNQGFWVDIYLPRDQKNFPSGIYYSKVKVIEKGKVISEIPLELTLLPFYMTDDNHSNVWLYSGDLMPYFPEMSQRDIDKMIKFEAHRHRINMEGGFGVNRTPFNRDSMDKYKAYLDGSAFTTVNGYQGPGEGRGEDIFPIGMYGSKVMGDNKTDAQKQADLWVDWFSKNASGTTYFWYIIDEPSDDKAFQWIKERTEWIKTNPGIGKSLPIFTTTNYNEKLANCIDIWAANDGVELNKLQVARKNGGDYWYYNGNRPRIGSIILEGAAVDFRVNSWILYKYGIKEWFIWEGTQWQHNAQGPRGHLHQNVFTDPLTFINKNKEFGNGDGILFYPGRMPFYPEQDRGLNQLFPSIRLKNIRRGQQDAALMWMVEQKTGREKVISLISKVVPKAMSEIDMTVQVPWSQNGNDYDKVRDELLKSLN